MSKGQGKKIGIKFTEPLIGDVTGWDPNPIGSTDWKIPDGVKTGDFTSITNIFDNNLTTYGYRNGSTGYIQIDFGTKRMLAGYRLFPYTSYRTKDIKLQGSDNASTWIDIKTSTMENDNKWTEVNLGPEFPNYRYYKWNMLNSYQSYHYIYELQVKYPAGNEVAFVLEGKEYQWLDGPNNNGSLNDKIYNIESVIRHPLFPESLNMLLLTVLDFNQFKNVQGQLKLSYDLTKGNLHGTGGFVESFEESFNPEDLIPLPNIGTHAKFSLSLESDISFIPMSFINGYEIEKFDLSLNAAITFIDMYPINP